MVELKRQNNLVLVSPRSAGCGADCPEARFGRLFEGVQAKLRMNPAATVQLRNVCYVVCTYTTMTIKIDPVLAIKQIQTSK